MSRQNAVSLILTNLPLIEEVSKFIDEELSVKLFGEIDHLLKETLCDWKGHFDFYNNGTSFAPSEWVQGEFENKLGYKNALARYDLWKTISKKENYWWISTLFRNEKDCLAFKFQGNWGNEQFKFTFKKWQTFCSLMNQKYPELEQKGFKFNAKEAYWYLPIKPLEINEIIESYEEDNLYQALNPISESLEILLDSHQYFQKIMIEAKNTKNFE